MNLSINFRHSVGNECRLEVLILQVNSLLRAGNGC
jgi:hypothetical protein